MWKSFLSEFADHTQSIVSLIFVAFPKVILTTAGTKDAEEKRYGFVCGSGYEQLIPDVGPRSENYHYIPAPLRLDHKDHLKLLASGNHR